MVVVFFTFALSGPLAPKEMGVILGVAVLLDTLLVRLLLLPAVLRLLGPAAWWTPRLLDRVPPGRNPEPPAHDVSHKPGCAACCAAGTSAWWPAPSACRRSATGSRSWRSGCT